MLQTKIFALLSDPSLIYQSLRAFVRYSCRLGGAKEIQVLYHLPLSLQERIGIHDLKEDVDYSIYRNYLYHALWTLTQQSRPHYRITASHNNLDPSELRYFYERVLLPEERKTIRSVPEPTTFSEQETWQVVKAIRKAIRSATYHQLRYCYKNDAGHSKEDFHADLECEAIKIVRRYEVHNLTVKEMIPLAAQSVRNCAANLAIFYGKDFRNPLLRLKKRTDYKTLWYCDIGDETVLKLKVYTEAKYRTGEYILAQEEDKKRYVYRHRLYSSESEAQAALQDYQAGENAHRRILVDLTSDELDDWQPTLASLNQPLEPGTTTPLMDLIPAQDCADYEKIRICVEELFKAKTDPKVYMFLLAVTGELGPLFESYVNRSTGKSSAELSSLALGRIARRYCGVNLKTITSKLAQPSL